MMCDVIETPDSVLNIYRHLEYCFLGSSHGVGIMGLSSPISAFYVLGLLHLKTSWLEAHRSGA